MVGCLIALSSPTARRPSLPKTFPWRDKEDDRAFGVPTEPSQKSHHFAEPLDEGEHFVNEMLELLEDVEVLLPSRYHSKVRWHPGLKEAVAIERRLREGQANDALDSFRAIVTGRVSLLELRKQGAGQKHGKAIRKKDAEERMLGQDARAEYHRLRNILRALGMSEDDATYRVITDEDASPYILTIEQRKPGARRTTPSWLWADFTFVDEQPDGPSKEFMRKSKWELVCDLPPLTLSYYRTTLTLVPMSRCKSTVGGGGLHQARRDVPYCTDVRQRPSRLEVEGRNGRVHGTSGGSSICAQVSTQGDVLSTSANLNP